MSEVRGYHKIMFQAWKWQIRSEKKVVCVPLSDSFVPIFFLHFCSALKGWGDGPQGTFGMSHSQLLIHIIYTLLLGCFLSSIHCWVTKSQIFHSCGSLKQIPVLNGNSWRWVLSMLSRNAHTRYEIGKKKSAKKMEHLLLCQPFVVVAAAAALF